MLDYLSYENIWELRELPESMLIVGAGSTGAEFAQAFQRLGTQVTLLDSEDRLLPFDDLDASNTLKDVFKSEGINLQLGQEVNRVWMDGNRIHLRGDWS